MAAVPDTPITRRSFLATACAAAGALAWPTLGRADRLSTNRISAAPYLSRPDLNPPPIAVTKTSAGLAKGLIFVAPASGAGQSGALILDNAGEPVWVHPAPAGKVIHNFAAQQLQGKPVLTWWEGTQVNGQGQGEYVIADSSYRTIKRLSAVDGYEGDLHEFLITSRNTALITVYVRTSAGLTEGVIQEIDIASGGLVFEWHSIDHVGSDESYVPGSDYFHLNSIGVLPDGNLLVSARHTSAVYKVDRRSGAIIWRLGGKKSDFTMGPGTGFSLQHDARGHADGTVTIFDDGGSSETVSRAIALALDLDAMTASLVHADANAQQKLSVAEGSNQRLITGGAFVGWGTLPTFSEFAADGTLLFDAAFSQGQTSYRARRLPWFGTPPGQPSVGVAHGSEGVTVGASWNGATGVARWRFLGGASGSALKPLATKPRSGFETSIQLARPPALVAAQALNAAGSVLGTSKPIRI